jgi:hypothetical protein
VDFSRSEDRVTAAEVELGTVCVVSDDVVCREIEGETIIIPLAGGIGDAEGELFSLNDTGRAVWRKLDGRRTLGQVAAALEAEYEAPLEELRRDVLGFANELVRRGILSVRA